MNDFDVLIVGAGVAGMAVAHQLGRVAPGLRVALVSLDAPGQAGATPWAQGGVAVAWGRDDTPALHAEDTLAAGAGLCRPEAVEVLTQEGPARIQELLDLGAAFDRDGQGQLELTREAAHQRRRVVHAGDFSGREVARTLASRLPASLQVRVGRVQQLLTRESRVVGILLDGQPLTASHVVLASGGVGQLFAATTNPVGAEGQCLAMAYEAGAVLRDLEFVQFHPTALALGGQHASLPLLTEALRGEGGRLVDDSGRAFMVDYHPDAELAPRDVVAFALWKHRQQGHQTFLDVTHLPVARRFPQVSQICQAAGLDPARDRLPVTPAVHYHMGGIEVDLWGQTGVSGLWACGEVSSSGVHGANRLASNSLLEGLVFGCRVGQALAECEMPRAGKVSGVAPVEALDPLALQRLREILWSGMGLARTGPGLERAQQKLEQLRQRRNSRAHSLMVAGLMLSSAAFRQESRGAHRRLDFPQARPTWAGHTRLRAGQGPVFQPLGLPQAVANELAATAARKLS